MKDNHSLQQELYLIADEIRGMASLSKHFAENVYEQERAHRLMELAAKIAALMDDQPLDEIKAVFETEPWMRFSPAIGVDALVLNEKQEILLIQRKDNQHWAMPGGLSEIGYTFSETAVKELWEEAGMRGEVKRLLGVFDGRIWGTRARFHLMHLVYQVDCRDLKPDPGIEALDARFFPLDEMPENMHIGHDTRIPKCFEVLSGETYFDPASSYDTLLSEIQRNRKASDMGKH